MIASFTSNLANNNLIDWFFSNCYNYSVMYLRNHFISIHIFYKI